MPADFDRLKINLLKAYSSPGYIEILRDLKQLAEKKGGSCLSRVYRGVDKPLLWQCKHGHHWKATPGNVKNKGSWCPFCGGTQRLSLDSLISLAREKGGKCLSKTYKNNEDKLLWECNKGHTWKAKVANVRQGKWCPICYGNKRLSIKDMQEIATKRGGKCLSTDYKNATTKLLWECSKGHRWEATSAGVKNNGTWCPKCADNERKRRSTSWNKSGTSSHYSVLWS